MKAGQYRQLRVFREGFGLAQEIFRLSLRFPSDERFSLTSQIRRSSRSVCTNIAEAWRRRGYPAAFAAKIVDAQAEAEETRVHLEFAMTCQYLRPSTWQSLDLAYNRLLARLERMRQSPEQWVPVEKGKSSPGRAGSGEAGPGKAIERERAPAKRSARASAATRARVPNTQPSSLPKPQPVQAVDVVPPESRGEKEEVAARQQAQRPPQARRKEADRPPNHRPRKSPLRKGPQRQREAPANVDPPKPSPPPRSEAATLAPPEP